MAPTCCASRPSIPVNSYGDMTLQGWAYRQAQHLLAKDLPDRWAHSLAVARKAAIVRPILGRDTDILVMAALLHDIGYSPRVAQTGFHPLDGALFLQRKHATVRLVALVAHHFCAHHEAELRGVSADLARWKDEQTPLRDALWWADLTTSHRRADRHPQPPLRDRTTPRPRPRNNNLHPPSPPRTHRSSPTHRNPTPRSNRLTAGDPTPVLAAGPKANAPSAGSGGASTVGAWGLGPQNNRRPTRSALSADTRPLRERMTGIEPAFSAWKPA